MQSDFHSNRMNEEFMSLLANVLDFIAQATENMRQSNGMPKLSCFYNRLVQLRKSFSECKSIASGDAANAVQPMIKSNAIPPINVAIIHEDLDIFADLPDSGEDSSGTPSEKSF